MTVNISVPGKIILTGEYAVVFGYPGIAVPSQQTMSITYEDDPSADQLIISSEGVVFTQGWIEYAEHIVALIEHQTQQRFCGALHIDNQLPLGKGMGSSTALVIGLCRTLLGLDSNDIALRIEETVNLGHSGIDFNVIARKTPIRFVKGESMDSISLAPDLLNGVELIDTGTPDQPTTELVAWVRERREAGENNVIEALEAIGTCTRRLEDGEDICSIVRDHHRAQVQLGVVPPAVREQIADIERSGGAAKVIGAGARTGGGGMVLSFT